MARNWQRWEVELIVIDYIEMLLNELSGVAYNKSATRRALMTKLDARSEGSIERKRMNISAALIDAGLPSISGYKPYSNYQGLLAEIVDEKVASDPRVKALLDRDVLGAVVAPSVEDILESFEHPPTRNNQDRVFARDREPRRPPLGLNYLEIDAANAILGTAGEEFCLRYEQARLIYEGAENLADRIEHVAETVGPSAGYDIKSFESDGSDRFIEVKTTKYGSRTPFFISPNEVRFSARNSRHYQLYRLHSFKKNPRLFMLPGSVEASCELYPSQLKATVR